MRRWKSCPKRGSDDWRDFRAGLVARERESGVGMSNEEAAEEQRKLLGWAHPSPLIEKGSVLLSEPGCGFSFQQQYFQKAVILLVDHRENFDMGIILNRPTAISTSQLGVPGHSWLLSYGGDCQGLQDTPGGSLDTMCLFCMHTIPSLSDVSKEIIGGLYFTNLAEAKAAVNKGQACVDDFLAVAGYCGWGKGQLQRELDAGGFWSLAAVDKRSLVRELRQAQARAALEMGADKVVVDDGTAAWHRLYDSLGRHYQDKSNAWRPDVMFGDQRLREWINANLARLDTGARGWKL